jgi:hypothetical protein
MNKPFGRMLSAFLVFMVLVTGTVFVEGIKVEAASYKSINLEGWKKYLRGGQYAGGFTMKAAYQEVLSFFYEMEAFRQTNYYKSFRRYIIS